jgi:hypothetical protein
MIDRFPGEYKNNQAVEKLDIQPSSRRTNETTAEIIAEIPFRLSVSESGVGFFNSL